MGPQHVNAVYAKTTLYGERIAQGMLISSLVSAALSRMMAPGFITESCQFDFPAVVRLGDTITAAVEVAEKDEATRRLRMRAVCISDKGEVVLRGTVVQRANSY